jgi:tryptophan 2,3-dioxygenase
MIAKSIIELLRPVILTDYIRQARASGRGAVDHAERQNFVLTLERVSSVYASAASLNYQEERLSNLVNDILVSERALLENPVPRYPTYTNIALLNRFIGVYSHPSVQRTWEMCRRALAIIVDDWLQFERHALDIFERAEHPNASSTESVGRNFQEMNVRRRIEGLQLLSILLAHVHRITIPQAHALPSYEYDIDWLYYALEEDGAITLAHLTALPQSDFHDEYLFLRTIHLTEVCLWATIVGIRVAVQAFWRKEFAVTLLALREANFFAEFLVRVFSVFKTLPVESFYDGFRVATGNSSAIQSEKYQHLEILSRSLSDDKRAALRGNKELSWLADWRPGPKATLPGLLQALNTTTFEHRDSVYAELYRLDRSLQSWRNIHLGVAREYLPPETVGTGEQGVHYLQKHFRKPSLFDSQIVAPADVPGTISQDAYVASADLSNIDIAFIISRDVSALKIAEVANALGAQTTERIKLLSYEKTYALSQLFRYYDPLFAKYGAVFPLRPQLQKAIKSGLPSSVIPRLLISLELSGGLLMGIHDGALSHIRYPIRVATAAAGQQFESIKGTVLPLKPDELILADSVRVFASYVQGPDKRTSIQMPPPGTDKIFASIVFVVFGAPGLPEADFRAALDIVRTAAFSVAGEPEVHLVRTRNV